MDFVSKPAADQTFSGRAAKYFQLCSVHVGLAERSSTAVWWQSQEPTTATQKISLSASFQSQCVTLGFFFKKKQPHQAVIFYTPAPTCPLRDSVAPPPSHELATFFFSGSFELVTRIVPTRLL